MKLHREGMFLIPVSILIVAAIVMSSWYFSVNSTFEWVFYPFLAAGIIMIALVINFFRNPTIEIRSDEKSVLSPCDGKVVVREMIEEDIYFKDQRVQISIFMSPLNVHVNRNPVSGKVSFFKYFPGKYLMAFNPKSSTDNEQTFLVYEKNDVSIGMKQIAGFLARRIKWYIREGDNVEQGEEMGFIRFGSRIDLLLPPGTDVKVDLGDKVKAGKTEIARFG